MPPCNSCVVLPSASSALFPLSFAASAVTPLCHTPSVDWMHLLSLLDYFVVRFGPFTSLLLLSLPQSLSHTYDSAKCGFRPCHQIFDRKHIQNLLNRHSKYLRQHYLALTQIGSGTLYTRCLSSWRCLLLFATRHMDEITSIGTMYPCVVTFFCLLFFSLIAQSGFPSSTNLRHTLSSIFPVYRNQFFAIRHMDVITYIGTMMRPRLLHFLRFLSSNRHRSGSSSSPGASFPPRPQSFQRL